MTLYATCDPNAHSINLNDTRFNSCFPAGTDRTHAVVPKMNRLKRMVRAVRVVVAMVIAWGVSEGRGLARDG